MPLSQRTLRVVPKVEDWRTPTKILHESIEHLSLLSLSAGNPWARSHMMAWEFSDVVKSTGSMKLEAALRDSILAWARYGETHRAVHGSNIGEDGVLGTAWKAQAQTLLIMLNGELGRLDGGTLDKLIRAIAETCGVDLEV